MKSGRHSQEHGLTKNILPAFEDLPLYQIDPVKVQQWVYSMEDRGLARSTRAYNLTVLRCIFEAAEQWGYFQGSNPCKRVNPGSGTEVFDRRALTPDEARKLIAISPEPLRLLIETALFTGLRVSELLGLTWEAIDHDKQVLTVNRHAHDTLTSTRLSGNPAGALSHSAAWLCASCARQRRCLLPWFGRNLTTTPCRNGCLPCAVPRPCTGHGPRQSKHHRALRPG
jgi:integrase